MGEASTRTLFLRRDEINDSEWNGCVLQSELPLVYALSWYLDVVAPGWCALVQVNEAGNYLAVFPVPVKWRFGTGFVYQPVFCQQLGLFAPQGSEVTLSELLLALPDKIKYAQLSLHTGHVLPLQMPVGWQLGQRITHHLNLQKPYAQLLKGYKGNLRRELQKPVPAGFEIKQSTDIDPTIKLFRQSRGKQVSELKEKHYRMLAKLVQVLQQHDAAIMLEARENSELISGGLFIEFAGRITYLFAGNSARARQTSANARLIDFLIKAHAEKPLLLDFEGGNIPGIGHFFRSFGAEPVTFVSLKMNKLPWLFSKFFR